MKRTFKTDRGYVAAFCCLWLILLADVVALAENIIWVPVILSIGFVYFCFLAGRQTDQGFIGRFVHAATDTMLISLFIAAALAGVLLLYWGMTDGFTGLMDRVDTADSAGVQSTDGRILVGLETLLVLLVFIGTPIRLRRSS